MLYAVVSICSLFALILGDDNLQKSKRILVGDSSVVLHEMEQLKAQVAQQQNTIHELEQLKALVVQQQNTIQYLSAQVNTTSCSRGEPVCKTQHTICPNGFVRHDSSCYKMYNYSLTMPEALTFCHAVGSHLVRTETRKEFDFVRNWIITSQAQFIKEGAFAGAAEIHSEGEWEWTETATPYTNIPWFPGQPNGYGGDCLVFWKGHNFYYGDHFCDWKGQFICELDLATV